MQTGTDSVEPINVRQPVSGRAGELFSVNGGITTEGDIMSTAASTQPKPARSWPVGMTTGIIRDVIAAILVFVSLFYHWNADGKGTSHWFVIVSVVIGLLGIVATTVLSVLAAFGLLGQQWNLGLNRLIRLATAVPMFASVIAIILIDVFSSGGFGDTGKAVGAGAILGGSGALMSAQSRVDERGPAISLGERALWKLLTVILGGIAVITLVLTTGLKFSTDDVLGSVFALVSSLIFALLVAAGVLGVAIRRRALQNLLISMGGFLAAAAFLSFDNDWSVAGQAFTLIQSTHIPLFGIVLIAMSGMAAMSFEARSDLPAAKPTDNLALGFWVTLAAFAVILVNLLFVVNIVIDQSDSGMDLPGKVIALLICLGAMTVVIGGASALVRFGGSSSVVSLILLAISVVLGITTAALSGDDSIPALDWVWFIPLIALGTVVFCWIGTANLSTIGTKLSATFAAPETGPTPTGPAPAGPTLTGPTPPASTPEPTVQPAASQGPPSPPAAPAAPPPPPADPDLLAAQDPATSPAELARLAAEAPHTRPEIARHPQAYPGLIEWLGQLGDPAVNEALRNRGG